MDSPPDRPALDLSAWPSPPAALPPRPVRREPPERSRRPLVVVAAGVVAVALTVTVVSTGKGTGAAAAACDVQLRFGADVQQADQRAVDAARAALAAVPAAVPSRPARTRSPAPQPIRSSAGPVVGPSEAELRAAEQAVASDEKALASAQDEYDRVVAEQQRAQDPGQYDEQVAAAEEALTVAREQLRSDQHELAGLREQARRAAAARHRPVAVVITPKAAPTAAPKPSASTSRAVLEQRLAEAQALQAEHLAARRTELAAAREKGCPAS